MTLHDRLASARAKVQPHARWAEQTWLGRLVERLFEMEFVDRAVALAAKAFVAFFPLLLVVSAFTPTEVRTSIVVSLQDRVGLGGQSLEYVRGAFVDADATRTATGAVGLILLFFYATTFTTALQRMYLAAWRRPRGGGLRNQGRGLIWMTGIIIVFAIGGSLRRLFEGPIADMATLLGTSLVGMALWWWTAWIMLRGEVRWRLLLPGAVVTGVAIVGYTVSASVWMPRTMASNQAQFGFFGVALSLVTWFVGMSFCLVVGTAVAPVLAEDTGWWGRFVRGDDDRILVDGAPPSLPPPIQRPTFLSALGGGSSAMQPDPEPESEPPRAG